MSRNANDETRAQKERLSAIHARTVARLQALEALQQKSQAEGKLPAWLGKMGLSQAARLSKDYG